MVKRKTGVVEANDNSHIHHLIQIPQAMNMHRPQA